MGVQNLTGELLGQYELRELLGVGGMGAVYRAYQNTLKRHVAIKVLPFVVAAQPGYAERFNREAEMAAGLEHPHIIPIYDHGMEQGVSYIVMRLLTGGTLAERIEQRAGKVQSLPSLGETAELLRQLAGALNYAHGQGVVHRDIKPSNVMFDTQGSAYIVDFGIAKLLESTKSLTTSGVMLGTPVYMAPEQWTAEQVSPATDEYVLAGMIYTLVAGQPPFQASTPYALMHKHLIEPVTPVSQFRPAVPESVQAVMETALAKDPSERYPNTVAFAQAFSEAIRGYEGKPTGFFTAPIQHKKLPQTGSSVGLPRRSITDPTPLFTKRPIYRRPLACMVMVPILGLLGLLAALAFSSGTGNSPPQDRPETQTQVAALNGPTAEENQAALVATQTGLAAEVEQGVWQTVTAVRLTEGASGPSETPAVAFVPSETPVVRPPPTARPTERPTASPPPSATPTPSPPASATPEATLTPASTRVLVATPDRQATREAQLALSTTSSDTPAPLETATSTLTPTSEAVPVALAVVGAGQIAFVSDRDGNDEIYVMETDGSNVLRLTSNNAVDESPAWSPDGRRIAFVSDRDGNREIYLMNADGSDVGQLTDNRGDDVSDPVWSPDGRQIAFSMVRDRSRNVYVIDVDGSNLRLLGEGGLFDLFPAWSPDGRQIAFSSTREDGHSQIYVMDTDGSNVRPLTGPGSEDYAPAWSPDGRLVVFVSSRDGNRDIFLMAANGGPAHRLTNSAARDTSPAWQPGSALAGEPVHCTVITADVGVKVRVGPGRTRGEFKDLAVDQAFTVIGKARGGDGALWWKLDRNQFEGGENAMSLWVAEEDVIENGDCALVADAEIPPLVVAPPAPTSSSAELPAGEVAPAGPQPTAPPGQPTYAPFSPTPVMCYTVSAQADPAALGSASIQTPPDCGGQYREGTGVTFVALISTDGVLFDHWSGCGSGGANPITVTISENCSMTAHFLWD